MTSCSCGRPFWLGRLFWKGGDGFIIDGIGPDGIAARVLDVTRNVVRLQTGYVYQYAFAMLLGAAAFITWFSARGNPLMFGFGILSGLLILPIVGALAIAAAARRRRSDAQTTRAGSRCGRRMRPSFSLFAWGEFNPASAGFQLVEQRDWFSPAMLYRLGVDGISHAVRAADDLPDAVLHPRLVARDHRAASRNT